MITTVTIIILILIVVNFLLLKFSCNKNHKRNKSNTKTSIPKIITNEQSYENTCLKAS